MTARTIIAAVPALYALFLAMRHNMHMFQLNGYKNDEHIMWLKKNIKRQWLLIFAAVCALFRIVFCVAALDILIYLTLIMIILVYRALRRLNNKKKLVFTARVKRMIATILAICLIVLTVTIIFFGIRPVTGVLVALVSAQLVMNIVANVINHPIENAISRWYINDAKRILREASDLKIIGVTGSYGKTSMKFFLQTLLQSKYNVLVTPGNFNTPLGVTITVREHLKPSHEIFICEMGARRTGEIKEICDMVHPDHGIITSVGPQHLETFHSIENIQKTKFELADSIGPDGIVFLNGDNEYIREMQDRYDNKVLYLCNEDGNGYKAKDIVLSQYGTDFTVESPSGETERFRMRLIGEHNVINVTGAIAVANTLGIPLRDLKVPVRRLQSVEHRMELREQGQVTIIDDAYNSNPAGSKAAVETLAMFAGLRILITPGMVELGESEDEYNRKFGTYAAGCCDYIILVGNEHTLPIKTGALEKGFSEDRIFVYDRLPDALSKAYSIKDDRHKFILLENDLPDNY